MRLALAAALLVGGIALAVSSAQAQVTPIVIDHDVTVTGIVSDRFTWKDSNNLTRVAVLGHSDVSQTVSQVTTFGGALREFRYQVSAAQPFQRVAGVTTYGNGGNGGFGYVVAHSNAGTCIGDDSPLGFYFAGTWQRIFEGRHHVIFRFTQNYPRNCPGVARTMPVTMDWIFSTGRDNPVYAISYDVDLTKTGTGVFAPADTLNDDSRAPYGELNIDGTGAVDIDGVAWGDRYKFLSTAAPVTLDSTWTWTVANTVPYVKLWINGPLSGTTKDATMGIVQTQTMTQQDAGGGRDPFYHDVHTAFWNQTSLTVPLPAAGRTYNMPWQGEWPYQANAFSIGTGVSNNNARMTWRTQWGFLGQTTYDANDNSGAHPAGYPKKSYSTYIVLGQHTASPVEAQVTQVETVQSLTLTATTGSVATSGPAGITRADNVTYQPAGYNHVYGALAFNASANRLTGNIAVGAGTLTKPLIIVGNYTAGNPISFKFNGTAQTADVDYFASVRSDTRELWVTLNRDLNGATNGIEIIGAGLTPAAGIVARGDFDGDGKADILLRDSSGNLGMWLMNGATILGGFYVGSPGGSYTVAGVGDFNGDGKADILLRDSTGTLGLWMMNGPTITAGALVGSPGGSYTVAGVADFNGDGKADILLRDATGSLGMWIMNGATISSGGFVGSPGGSYNVAAVGDFNGDGKADILLRDSSGSLGMWFMNGFTVTAGAFVGSPGGSYDVAGLGDFNADGKADILLRDSIGNIGMWLMNGSAITAGALVGSPGGYTVAAVKDYNGDGKADILLRDSGGTLGMWIMSGTTISSGAPVGAPGAGSTAY